ncbi:MAG: hypothetical protein JWM31_1350 [Solirubrobacterales bacterium]|nr:hypothetical protein [Solirubrobacterales bacterium]
MTHLPSGSNGGRDIDRDSNPDRTARRPFAYPVEASTDASPVANSTGGSGLAPSGRSDSAALSAGITPGVTPSGTSTDRRFLERDVVQVAARAALAVADPPLTDYGIATAAASLAVVLADPTHPNHERAMAKYLPPHGTENGKPFDVYCECGLRVEHRFGAWICPSHHDRATVKFIERTWPS